MVLAVYFLFLVACFFTTHEAEEETVLENSTLRKQYIRIKVNMVLYVDEAGNDSKNACYNI